MTCEQCQGWMLEERQIDFSPDTFVWPCIHCASIADPQTDQSKGTRERTHFLLAAAKIQV